MPRPTRRRAVVPRGNGADLRDPLRMASGADARRFDAAFVRERETSSRSSAAARRVFLVAQVAIAVVVLVGAALFVRTERALRATELGFDADRLLVLAMSPQNAGASPDKRFRSSAPRATACGPCRVSATSRMDGSRPLINASWETKRQRGGLLSGGRGERVRNAVGPRYFTTLGIPLVAGREFIEADDITAPKVAIVNETFARMSRRRPAAAICSARASACRRPTTRSSASSRTPKYSHLREAPTAVWYVPYEQQPNVKYLDMYMRTSRRAGGDDWQCPRGDCVGRSAGRVVRGPAASGAGRSAAGGRADALGAERVLRLGGRGTWRASGCTAWWRGS